MNSWAFARLARFASSILNRRAVKANTPPAVQSTPVCMLQGKGGTEGGGGGGGGLLAEEDVTEELRSAEEEATERALEEGPGEELGFFSTTVGFFRSGVN